MRARPISVPAAGRLLALVRETFVVAGVDVVELAMVVAVDSELVPAGTVVDVGVGTVVVVVGVVGGVVVVAD